MSEIDHNRVAGVSPAGARSTGILPVSPTPEGTLRGAVPPVDQVRFWLTADMLAARAAGASALVLAANEFLTPAAQDYAQRHHIQLCRDGRVAGVSRSTGVPPVSITAVPAVGHGQDTTRGPDARDTHGRDARATPSPTAMVGTLGLVVHRPDLKVQAALAGLPRAGIPTAAFATQPCPMANTREMCRALADGQIAGGVVIDRYAAGPMALAGKCRGARPVQGTTLQAVLAALRQFDANVLVLGHAELSVFELKTMLERFAAGRTCPQPRTALLAAIEAAENQ